jgi:hypothetical protein
METSTTRDLVQDLSRQTSTLIRQEMRLAQAELAEKGRHAGKGAGMFGGAGLLLVAGILALTGKKELEEAGPPKPEQTLESVQRDVATVKERARS